MTAAAPVDTQRMSEPVRPSVWRWLAWAVPLLTCSGSLFFTSLFTVAFSKPHAFGGRDGQGAAGLAALMWFGAGDAALISGVVLLVLTSKLRTRFGVAWAWPVAFGLPVVGALLGALLGVFG